MPEKTYLPLSEEPAAALRRWRRRHELSPHFGGIDDLLVIAGPPACGKKRLAYRLAEAFGREVLHLHMGEFSFADDIGRLLDNEKGILHTWVAQHPAGVVIFDDIDACDHSIQRAVAAIVSDGASACPGHFRQTIFLFTFNVKAPEWTEKEYIDRYYEQPLLEQARFYEALAAVGAPDENGTVRRLFDPQLLNVLSESDLILLYPHDLPQLLSICQSVLQACIDRFQARYEQRLNLEHPVATAQALLLSFSPYLNSTRIAHRLGATIFDLLAPCLGQDIACDIRVSKAARNTLSKLFSDTDTVKSFGKYDRRFRLVWSRKSGNILLKAVEEIEDLPAIKEAMQNDRLHIRAGGPVGFDDIAGQQRAKEQLGKLIRLLGNEKALKHFDITLPKGVLLYGPEGVGKTMLVKALAKEAALPYLYLRGSDLFDEGLIEEAYTRARLSAPMMIILEGVDLKGLIDGSYTPIPTEALEQGIDHSPDRPDAFVFTVMTAHNKDEVPESLMHPGRVDQFVEVPELDRDARRFFAKKLLEKPHDKIDIERISRYMTGMNGYELGRIAKACALEAIKQGKSKLDEQIVIDQINTIKYGSRLDKKRLKNFEEDLRQSAIHEAAHAVVTLVLLPDVEIEQVTVIPRSEALGLVSYAQEEIQTNLDIEELRGNIAVSLAGRIATVKAFGEKGLETGAHSDLQQATMYAYSAVAMYGMDTALRNLNVEILLQNISNTLYSEKIEDRISRWIEEGTERATKVIDAHWTLIESIAQRLIKEEFIEGSELKKLYADFTAKEKAIALMPGDDRP